MRDTYRVSGPDVPDTLSGDMTREDARYYAAWLTRLRGSRYVAVRVPYAHTGFECGAL